MPRRAAARCTPGVCRRTAASYALAPEARRALVPEGRPGLEVIVAAQRDALHRDLGLHLLAEPVAQRMRDQLLDHARRPARSVDELARRRTHGGVEFAVGNGLPDEAP